MPRGESAKTFEEKVLRVIAETKNEKGGGTVLRVMSWVVDGRVGKPQIDKRDRWQTEDGSWRIGKAKGLTGMDLLAILQNINEIAVLLQIPKQDLDLTLKEKTAAPNAVPAGGPF